MNDYSALIHSITIALMGAINTLSASLGAGVLMYAALNALNIQPSAKAEISKASLIGLALLDTSAIMGFTMAFMILMDSRAQTEHASIAELGMTCAMCLPGLIVGLVSALPAYQACLAIARQPFFAQKITRLMLIGQSLIQTPIIFGFIIAILIKGQLSTVTTFAHALQLLAGGLCIGLGSIGPAIGMAYFAYVSCQGLGVNRHAYSKLFSFTFISQAIIETPIIFAFVIAIMILFTPGASQLSLLKGTALFGAALCTGLGTIGPGISSGRVAAAACRQIAYTPEHQSILARSSMICQGLIDTSAIYALIISIMLILFI